VLVLLQAALFWCLRDVNEEIFLTVVGFDEAVAFASVEPLDGAGVAAAAPGLMKP
jgi:hypothetical protein